MNLDAADLAAFVDPDMPGYVQATVGGVAVAGLYRGAPVEQFGVQGYAPELVVRSSDALAVAEGAAVTIGATSFTVASVERDRGDDATAGFARLRLAKV